MTRWPEAFSRVVPEGDALAYDFRVRVGEVLLRSIVRSAKVYKNTMFFNVFSYKRV